MGEHGQIGLAQAKLDEIELRLAGADHRPWVFDRNFTDRDGRPMVRKAGKKQILKGIKHTQFERGALHSAMQRIDRNSARLQKAKELLEAGDESAADQLLAQQEPMPDRDALADDAKIGLFRLCPEVAEDVGEFVAKAPEDVECLLIEVKFLRGRYRDAEKERDEFKKEMLSLRVERAALQEKLSTARRTWRELTKLMDGQP